MAEEKYRYKYKKWVDRPFLYREGNINININREQKDIFYEEMKIQTKT